MTSPALSGRMRDVARQLFQTIQDQATEFEAMPVAKTLLLVKNHDDHDDES